LHPRALTIVASLFMISGVVALIGVATDLVFHGRINIDFSVLNFWIGRWLLAGEPRGRQWALFVIQLSLVFLPLAGVILSLTPASPELRVFGVLVGHTSVLFACVFVASVWALQLWQYRVLNRADIRSLFREASGELAAPSE
jgi:hypothetical protein